MEQSILRTVFLRFIYLSFILILIVIMVTGGRGRRRKRHFNLAVFGPIYSSDLYWSLFSRRSTYLKLFLLSKQVFCPHPFYRHDRVSRPSPYRISLAFFIKRPWWYVSNIQTKKGFKQTFETGIFMIWILATLSAALSKLKNTCCGTFVTSYPLTWKNKSI